MKLTFLKINLPVLCIVVIFLSGCKKDEPLISNFEDIQFPNDNELSWDYPVKPGSDKWKTFHSYAEMLEVCQIPEIQLSYLPTEELLLICLKYPLLLDIGAFNFFSDGYSSFENNFNGIRELNKRNDASAVIYNYYRQIKLENANIYSSIFFVFKVSVVEYTLSAPSVISKYSASQRKEVATELLSKLNIKKLLPDNFPINYQNSTYRALFMIIKCDEAGNLSPEDARIAGYFTGVGAAPESIMKQVEEIINQYFAKK